MAVLGDIALELIPEAVGPLQYGNLTGHPQGAAEAGIPVFRQLGLATECAELDGCQVPFGRLLRNRLPGNANRTTSRTAGGVQSGASRQLLRGWSGR